MAKLDFRPAAAFAVAYGPWPDDYLVVDTETTGLDPDADWPVQVGWCAVAGRRPLVNAAAALNWPDALPAPALASFEDRLWRTARKMAARGNRYPWTVALLREKGVQPAAGLARAFAARPPGGHYVAHYGWGFDYPLVGRVAADLGLDDFAPPHEHLWDTAMLVKACQTGLVPKPNEPLRRFLGRLNDAAPRGRYSLTACVSIFDLAAAGAAAKEAHDAGYDAWLSHLVFERLRDGAEKEAKA